jgi:peptidoglycan/LPS O-acetylase OafA/YrhL
MPASRFPVLDTVRGLAFLMVVFAHTGQARGIVATGISQFGLWIFFVLSAFLLSRRFFEEPDRVRNSREIKRYLLRRALRIFPPLAVSLTAYALVFPNFTWQVCAGIFLCVRVYGIFWTVFIETRYYLLLPLVVAAVLALKTRPKVLGAVLAAGIALHVYDCPFWLPRRVWRAMLSDADSTWLSREHLFVQFLPIFVGGTLLAAAHFSMAGSNTGLARMRRWAPLGVVAALAGFAACSAAELGLLPWPAAARIQFQGLWLPLLPLPLALVFSAANLTGGPARFFAHPVFRFVGKISYSGYLFHQIFVKQLSPLIPNNALYACTVLAATLAVATAGHYLIERPCLALSGHP